MSPATTVERAPFGATGHQSSRVIFGAAALSRVSQDKADTSLPLLLEHGVNHIDTAADYGDSELRLAPWLARHPGRFFLNTKTHERRGDGARAGLERSLGRLGVDHVDLIQLHNLVEEDEWETAHGPGGAVEALARARDEGLCRFIGVTGHGLRIARMHLRSLERFDFAAVLLPYSHVLLRDEGYRRDVEELLEVCAGRNVAVQTIKAVARRRWAPDHEGPRFSWYDALPPGDALDRAVRHVLAQPRLFLNTSSDLRLLGPTLAAAARAPGAGAPAEAELEADVVSQAMAPIFDGGALERI
ncbi:MAG TPA: aldo/keto reductase [Acidimicrobiales bacterium]|nr:aldo/keto reductase [Acidimicrobiales bacterium]